MEEKCTYPSDSPQPMGMVGEAGPRRTRFDPERTKHLMTLAESIAVIVNAQTRPGRERCRLRSMVELFLDE